VDLLLGLATRASSQPGLQELGVPLRLLGGGALLWLGIGVMSERLLSGLVASGGALRALLEGGR
jgi:flagellar biosynthesis protein FliR